MTDRRLARALERWAIAQPATYAAFRAVVLHLADSLPEIVNGVPKKTLTSSGEMNRDHARRHARLK